MKRIFSLLIFLGLPAWLFAQLDSFNLAAYKLPDIKTQKLDFSLAGDGLNYFNYQVNGSDTTKNNDARFHGNFGATYSLFRNRADYQGEQYASLSFNSINSTQDTRKQRSTEVNLSVRSTNRAYFNKGLFLQYGIIMSDALNFNYHTRFELTPVKGFGNSMTAMVPLLIGKGRIEPVQDARLAVYILEDLIKTGSISRIPDQEEIMEFARLISATKNKRFFDSRIKRIWEIEMIDAWLQSRNFLTKTDATYFTRLYDNWIYSSGPVRESGKRFSAGFEPEIYADVHSTFISGDTAGSSREDHQSYTLRAVIRHEKANPINLYWQSGHLLELAGLRVLDDPANDWYTQLTGRIQYSWGWFPNSRTNMDISVNLAGDYYGPDVTVESGELSYFVFYPDIRYSFYYYISPELRLTIDYNGSYSLFGERRDPLIPPFIKYRSGHALQQSLSLKISYSLF